MDIVSWITPMTWLSRFSENLQCSQGTNTQGIGSGRTMDNYGRFGHKPIQNDHRIIYEKTKYGSAQALWLLTKIINPSGEVKYLRVDSRLRYNPYINNIIRGGGRFFDVQTHSRKHMEPKTTDRT